jgi:hypothetical protein
MGRKPREDRSTVGTNHLGLRLTDREHAAVVAIVHQVNEQLAAQGLPAVASMTWLMKKLILEEAARRGLLPAAPASADKASPHAKKR